MIDLTNKPECATHYDNEQFYKYSGTSWSVYSSGFNAYIIIHTGSFLCDFDPSKLKAMPCADWSIHNNTKPLSELSDEQRGLLFNHWCNGGGIVDYRNMGACPSWDPDNVYRAKQKSERELFIEAAKNSASLRARDGADTVYGELFDAGFKAPKVGE